MTNQTNQAVLARIGQAFQSTDDPTAQLLLRRTLYLHQIIDALLSENTDDLLVASNG